MNLEQFKKQFESDAQKRSAQQEKTIRELHARIASLNEAIEERDKHIQIRQTQGSTGYKSRGYYQPHRLHRHGYQCHPDRSELGA